MSNDFRYRSPQTVLRELGITEPQDICIEAIAQYCDATIIYEPLQGSAARILGFGDQAFITVDSKSRRERQRFSAAHELGHWMRDRQQMASVFTCKEQIFSQEWGQDNPERRANVYAAELLMPDFIFRGKAKNIPINFESVRQLATLFQTSITATAIRLVESGSYPALIVCNSPQRRLWFARGKDVPEALRLKDTPGPYTIAADLLRGSKASLSPTDVSADGWFSHYDSRRYLLREDSIKIGSEDVLTLLWWKNESQLLDLERENDY